MPQIQLAGKGSSLLTEEGLDSVIQYAEGIGPDKRAIEGHPEIVQWAHARGLAVHPYTFRADHYPSDLYEGVAEELEQFFFTYDVDGVFTDFPDKAVAVRSSRQ